MFSPRIGKSIRLELILSAIIFVGLFLVNGSRVWEFFWSDEIITIEATGILSWSELVVNRYWAAHSPLYFAILKVWLGVLSMFVDIQEHAEFLARLPSAVATSCRWVSRGRCLEELELCLCHYLYPRMDGE